MSKSYGNAIFLSETAEETSKKVLSMVTDTQRVRRSDPGEPDICVAWSLNHQYLPQEKQAEICAACRNAAIGCVDCKKLQATALVESLAPFRARREELTANPSLVDDILSAGAVKAAQHAAATMLDVREALKV